MSSEQPNIGKRRLKVALLGGAILLAILFSLLREMGVVATFRLYRTQKQLQEENAKLRDEIGLLRQEMNNLKTNPAYIEEIARKELGLIGRKEDVIVLDRNKNDQPPSKSGTRRP